MKKCPRKVSAQGIQPKEKNILWARAHGQCSMPGCFIELIKTTENDNNIIIGEMCHIIGEKHSPKSPRGVNKLPLNERNLYQNLILLCPNHHEEIDKNESEWTVEKLCEVKHKHELRCKELRELNKLSAEDIIYKDNINIISSTLNIDSWDWFIENAVRQIVHEDFIYALDNITERRIAIILPDTHQDLNKGYYEFNGCFY